MANHLRLLGDIPLPSKRKSNRLVDPKPFDRGAHATTLRGILEGLESSRRGIFGVAVDGPADEPETDASDLGEIVLKFSGRFGDDKGAFNHAGMTALAASDNTRLYALTTDQSRRVFASYAQTYIEGEDLAALTQTWRDLLDRIDGVELYDTADRVAQGVIRPTDDSNADLPEIDIALWPTSIADRNADKEGLRRVTTVRDVIAGFTAGDTRVRVVAYDDTHTDRLLIRARVNSAAFDAVAAHPYVEKLRGSLQISVTQTDLAAAPTPPDALLPEGAPIGIIDDLVVTDNPWLTDIVVEQQSFPAGFDYGQPTRHGTHVAGFAAWGDVRKLLDPDCDAQPHPIYVARVAQANEHLEPQFVYNATELVAAALDWFAEKEVRIVVLAFAYAFPDNGALTADLSAVIDEKCREHSLVVVVPAGNVTDIGDQHWHNDYPKYLHEQTAKIAAPGTAALAVTVGSVAHDVALDRARWPHGLHIAEPGEPAPFTRTGPVSAGTKAGRQKPEFVAHGGSWGWDQSTDGIIYDDPNLAAVALIPPRRGRLFGTVWGTSYAAPLVAHEIARIQTRYPDAGANLLRALTALSGNPPPAKYDPDKPVISTYGTPNADNVLESGSETVIFVYEGEIKTNSHTVLEIPIPVEFATGISHREFSVALAFDPPARRSRRDYIAGRMQFDFHQKLTLQQISEIYAEQPSEAEAEANPALTKYKKPTPVNLRPASQDTLAGTVIHRRYEKQEGGWSPDDAGYYLVITHEHSPWTKNQKKSYPDQDFAVAVRIRAFDRSDIDLYALAQARLQARARARGGNQ
ncbi:S8 family serine peptidase [Mycobacteroides abscessus subsp. abscessus]|uniref:S8 family serine peptidase n=1 Tax=Mycobacteroides abscessus TaxID=36809 RepID=UPI0009284A17|nr:S8 family serine peptidase [Mycobacteroides abscessus]AWG52260.1 hypothetical protein DDT48_24730 [Mycobacteroides abscessus]MBN7551082.1 S8 family serine peptidase [Mycobacteroides abscessus subsp. abscessus]MDO3099780.1 S8 family serine peptidase [Mycobacteroides abscessus subsp. abscessus]MDO3187548.1 S8 family serine peptidase [Mycobacteroides abscessus subsp. abscessus]MDO3192408.1 S8 family serine peptidase [Mycobacteroides abscessus subsp. abscessus]